MRANRRARFRPKDGPSGAPDLMYQQILDGMQLGVAVLQLDDPGDPGSFRVVQVNPAASRLVGPQYAVEESVGKTLREAFPESLNTPLPQRLLEVIQTGAPQDLGEIRPTRDLARAYAVKVFPLPRKSVGVVFEDVTSRRGAQERIERNEARLARAQQLARMGSWSWDVRSDKVTWSDELYHIYGLAPGTFPGTLAAFLDRLHPDDREMVETTVRRSLERREPFRFKERIIRPDGEIRVLDSQGDVLVDAQGVLVELFGFCRDVTEDERAGQAARESEERFAKTVQASPVAICVMTLADGRLIDVNPRFLELLGYGHRGEVVGRTAGDVGMWAGPGEREQVAADLKQRRSIREAHVLYRTLAGQASRALASLELIEVGGQECMLALFWRM